MSAEANSVSVYPVGHPFWSEEILIYSPGPEPYIKQVSYFYTRGIACEDGFILRLCDEKYMTEH